MKREDLRNRLIRLAGQLTVVTQALDDASTRLSRYLFLQFLVNAAYGLVFALGTYVIGIPHPLLWGVLACLLRFIPYIGTGIAAAVPTLMAFAIFPGWRQAIFVFGLFIILELIISNVIEPWLYGAHTGISSLAILVAAVFWTVLWGPIGLILSTPLTVCLILMGRYVPELTFLEVLLGDEPVLPAEATFYQRLLAFDQDEPTAIAENYLKEKPIGSFYDTVLIPALAMAEQDRHSNTLDQSTAAFVAQTTRELIEDLGERPLDAPKAGELSALGLPKLDFAKLELPKVEVPTLLQTKPAEAGNKDQLKEGQSKNGNPRLFSSEPVPNEPLSPEKEDESEQDYTGLAGLHILCIPARDEADELVALMLEQLLKRLECDVRVLPIFSRGNDYDDITSHHADYVIVSALPPFAVGRARSVCKRLRGRDPQLKMLLALWNFEGGLAKAQDRLGRDCADMVATSLQETINLIANENRPERSSERIRAQRSAS
jgi:hypothetical protein